MTKRTEERRRHRRQPYETDAQVAMLATGWISTGRLEDLSVSGCYINTLVPPEQGTRIRVSFPMDSEEFGALGVVRYARPGLGMGVEFTHLGSQEQQLLLAFLEYRKPGGRRQRVPEQGELPFEPDEPHK